MKREIRDKRNEYRDYSVRLKELSWKQELSSRENFILRERQDECYKRFKFYDSMIKANDKVRSNNE